MPSWDLGGMKNIIGQLGNYQVAFIYFFERVRLPKCLLK